MRSERGAGTVVTMGVGLGVVALFMLAMPLYAALAARHSVSAAADAAALGAADAASGLVRGHPCDVAVRIAAENGVAVEKCRVDGLVVTVTTTRLVLGFVIAESATAGPAGSGAD
ncbi:MAG: hypothetical protein KF761_06410 [Salinibacterium sp.]|nr:hypothetical protein [Salinibacterium sp.]